MKDESEPTANENCDLGTAKPDRAGNEFDYAGSSILRSPRRRYETVDD